MSTSKKVFLIGPGFIGWNVLELLINEGYTVSGLVRRESHGDQIKNSGALPIQGDLDDHDLIVKHVLDNDITIHTATADHLPSVQAVIDGIKQRTEAGKPAIFIHTSGTSVLEDGSHGEFRGDKVYYDTDADSINKLPDDAPHRQIDLTILRASRELGEKAKFAIMMPPAIYGFNHNHRRLSIQIPTITRFALKHGYAGHVGKGLGVWSQIHVLDLSRAYMVLLHYMERSPSHELLQNPYFFCENGKEFSWKEVADEVGKALHARGLIKDAEPKTFNKEQYEDLFGDFTSAVIGTNSRSRAMRLRALGWEANEKSIWESYNEDELPEMLAEDR